MGASPEPCNQDAHLTDDNIQQLLAEAEQRLHNTMGNTTNITLKNPSTQENIQKYIVSLMVLHVNQPNIRTVYPDCPLNHH